MIVLGISGLENRQRSRTPHFYASGKKTAADYFAFSEGKVPLQYFPLQLLGHDSSAALIVDGQLVACAAEERFTRVKHGFNLAGQTVLPRRAIRFCLDKGRISWDQVDFVAHYCHFNEDIVQERLELVAPGLNLLQRKTLEDEYAASFRKRLSRDVIQQQLEEIAGQPIRQDRLLPVRHHLAHAAGSFFSSGFPEALIVTSDGYGETDSSVWAVGEGGSVSVQGSIRLPDSLGLLYQALTVILGFRSFGDEYKVMGLSAYGDFRKYRSAFEELVRLLPDGRYSTRAVTRPDFAEYLEGLLGVVPRAENFSRAAADIAAALQNRLEEAELHQLSYLKERYGLKRLCLSGGVALNARANGRILSSKLFEKIFVQPAASDEGAGLGAALYAWHELLGQDRSGPIRRPYWGPEYSGDEIERVLKRDARLSWRKDRAIEERAAEHVAAGKIVGWFQGRTEMGPRALGARSILADPRSASIKDKLNRRTKEREAFRPFAPSVLLEDAPRFFEMDGCRSSPFMLFTFATRPDKKRLIPGVVHVDGSSRLQTVSPSDNPRYYRLLRNFKGLTGIPLVLNTSFNRAGEPIVNSPEDAVRCFWEARLDTLAIGDYIVTRGTPASARRGEPTCG